MLHFAIEVGRLVRELIVGLIAFENSVGASVGVISALVSLNESRCRVSMLSTIRKHGRMLLVNDLGVGCVFGVSDALKVLI